MPCPGQKPRTLRTLRRFFYFSISRFLGWLTFYLLRPPALACYAYILTHNFLSTPASARSLAQALRGSPQAVSCHQTTHYPDPRP